MAGYAGLGFYRLAIYLDLTYNLGSSSGAAALEIPVGELRVRSRGGHNYLLGSLLPAQGPVVLHATRDIRVGPIEFVADLSQHQLKAIEDLRRGGELTFVATLYPGLHAPQGYLRQVPLELSLPVNQSDWARIRKGTGAGRTLLYEIREPGGELNRTAWVMQPV
jgi:hypothetical protein